MARVGKGSGLGAEGLRPVWLYAGRKVDIGLRVSVGHPGRRAARLGLSIQTIPKVNLCRLAVNLQRHPGISEGEVVGD